MAFTVDDKNAYNAADAPTVTIDGGSGTERLILVVVYSSRSGIRTLDDVVLDGNSADVVVSHSVDGGVACNGGYAYFLNANCPANGSFTLSSVFSASINSTHCYILCPGLRPHLPRSIQLFWKVPEPGRAAGERSWICYPVSAQPAG